MIPKPLLIHSIWSPKCVKNCPFVEKQLYIFVLTVPLPPLPPPIVNETPRDYDNEAPPNVPTSATRGAETTVFSCKLAIQQNS